MSSTIVALALLLAVPEEIEHSVATLAATATDLQQPVDAAVPHEPAARPPAPAPPLPPEAAVEQATHGDELVVTGRSGAPKGDPLERVNMASYDVTQAVDRAFVRPVAKGYQKILPNSIRDGIRNIINNLREPVVFLNFLLQLKPGKAAETVGRFAINSTIGIAGAFDFAKRKPFHLPRRPNGLGNTLGYYGVGTGPFLFVPLVGPTTLRDLIGDGLDRLVMPLAVGHPFDKPAVGIPVYVFSSLDQRAEFDEKLEALHSDKVDPYATTREDYLRNRQAAIDALHGKKPVTHDPDAEPDEVQPMDKPDNAPAVSTP